MVQEEFDHMLEKARLPMFPAAIHDPPPPGTTYTRQQGAFIAFLSDPINKDDPAKSKY